jgi:hypothetical protein
MLPEFVLFICNACRGFSGAPRRRIANSADRHEARETEVRLKTGRAGSTVAASGSSLQVDGKSLEAAFGRICGDRINKPVDISRCRPMIDDGAPHDQFAVDGSPRRRSQAGFLNIHYQVASKF